MKKLVVPICGYEEARGDQCENCGNSLNPLELINPKAKPTGDTPIVKETTNLYFPLSKYKNDLQKWIESKNYWKQNVLNYCKGLYKTGLVDRSVTRDLKWGIPVPVEQYKDKVIYVWIEAPVGYISATKDLFIEKGTPDKWESYWKDKETKLIHFLGKDNKLIHFLGKDNIIFHAVIFPSMLMAHGDYVLPDNVPANEFLNINGGKFSKSKGIGWTVNDTLKLFKPDVIRYAIAASLPENKDSEFSFDDFVTKNNSELSDILGNYINRVLVFAKSKFDNEVPKRIDDENNLFLETVKLYKERIANLFDNYKFREALIQTMNIARDANKYFNDCEPWKIYKINDCEPWKIYKTDKEKCGHIINDCLQICYSLSIAFSPFIPEASDKILKMLNANKENFKWDRIGDINIKSGHKLGENEILFPKIEIEQESTEKESVSNFNLQKRNQ